MKTPIKRAAGIGSKLAGTILPLVICAGLTPLASAAHAQAPEQVATKLPKVAEGYRLDGPAIMKVNRRSRDLIVEDLNGDGLPDFAVVTNEKSILEVFHQKADTKGFEDRFEKQAISLDRIVRGVAARDVDGDGRVDLMLATAPAEMAIMYQDKDGTLKPPVPTGLTAARLVQGDIDGDSRPDVLVYTDRRFDILKGNQRGLDLESTETFFTTGEPAMDPMLLDVDGDGRLDIVYHDATRFEDLVIRLQSTEKTFPSEFRVTTSVLRVARPWTMGPGERGLIASVHNNTRALMLMRLKEAEPQAKDAPVTLSDMQTIPFDPELKSGKVSLAIADVDGDGRRDLVASSPDLSVLRIYRQTRSGALMEERYPSLLGVELVQATEAGAGAGQSLILYSPGEKAIGLATFDRKGDTLPFPTILPVAGEPAGVALARIGGRETLAVVIKNADRAKPPALLGHELKSDGTLGEGANLWAGDAETTAAALKGLDIKSLEAMDVNRDGRDDLVVYADFKPAMIFIQQEDSRFTRLSASSEILDGLLSGAQPRNLNVARLDASEKAPLSAVALKEKFARAFTIDEKGNIQVEHQLNGRNASSRLIAMATGRLRGKDSIEVVLLDRANRELTIYSRTDKQPGFEQILNHRLDSIDYNTIDLHDLDGDGLDDILLTAEDRLCMIYTHAIHGGLETIAMTSATDEEGGYGTVYTADLLPGRGPELIAIEMKDNLMELFLVGDTGPSAHSLDKFYHFKMFDTEAGMGRRSSMDSIPEPREIIAADLDEDGRPELVCLTHDNVIIYQPTEGKSP